MSTPIRCIDEKPAEAGEYTISIEGVLTFAAIFMTFDGEDWVWSEHASYLRLFNNERERFYWYKDNG